MLQQILHIGILPSFFTYSHNIREPFFQFHALILLQGKHTRFRLPLSLTALERLHQSLVGLTGARCEDESPFASVSPADFFPDGGESARAGMGRAKRGVDVETLLKVLWEQVAEPIIQWIMNAMDEAGKGKSTPWAVPVSLCCLLLPP